MGFIEKQFFAATTGQYQQGQNRGVVDGGKTLDTANAHAFDHETKNLDGFVELRVHPS